MRKSKIMSVLLAALMLVSLVPTMAFAAGETTGEIVTTQVVNDKHDLLTLETYLTAETVQTGEKLGVPADIVLVLDQSGSMAGKYDNGNTRQAALKKAVSDFVEKVAADCTDQFCHRLAVVTFNSKASTLVNWTDVNQDGVNAIEGKINGLPKKPTGGTYMDLGLNQAGKLIGSRSETTYTVANGTEKNRQVLVVLFADGYPGELQAAGDYFSNYYNTPKEADDAVAAAAKLKSAGATICTVGAFADANPTANYTTTKKSAIWTVWRSAAKSANGLMHFISSDYDASCTSWRDHTAKNDGRNNGYYLAASDTAGLCRAFKEIVTEYVMSNQNITLDANAVLQDVISDYFTVKGNVSVYTAAYDAQSGTFGAETPCTDINVTVDGKTVTVTGFDYSDHWCGVGAQNGQKLIVKIPVQDTVDEFGVYPATANGSGLYDAQGNIVAYAPAVKVNVANAIDLSENATCTADVEKFFSENFSNNSFYKDLWPTMSSLRKVGDNLYLLDYQYDYDIDDLMATGVSSAVDLLGYASKHILKNEMSFKMGEFNLGCSAYEAYNEDGDHIMGRNFDYMDAPCYMVWTHPDDAYASISMVDGNFLLTTDHLKPTSTMGRLQTLLAPYLCLDGMNETGFAITVLQIHENGTAQDNGKTDMFTTAMIRACLDKCASVDEAIQLFASFDLHDTIAFNYSLGCCYHYLLTDASGDAAIIEYVNNEMRVIRSEDPEFQRLYVTNFYVSPDGGVGSDEYDPEGMERYEIIGNTLAENNNVLNFDQAFNLLSDVHLNYRHKNNLYDITTLWSNVYNNSQKTVSIAPRMNYNEIYTFSVTHPMRVYGVDSVAVTTPREGVGLH